MKQFSTQPAVAQLRRGFSRISDEITSGGPGHSHIHNLTWTGHEFLEKRLDIFLPFQKLGARKAGL